MTAASPAPSRRAALFAVALCDGAMMSLAIAINLLPVFLTTLSRDLGGLSEEQLGRIGAVTFAGLVVGIFLTGPLADRLGGRLFAGGGNVFIAAGLALMGFAGSYEVVLIASFVMGLGAGSLDMILSPIVAALQPDRRTVAMNLLHSFYSTGAVATILIGALALRVGIGWHAVALALLPLPLLVGLAFFAVPIPPMVEAGEARTPLKDLLANRYFLLALVAIFLGGSTELGLAYWLPAYAETTLGYSKWTAGMATFSFAVAMALGRIGILLLPRSVGPIPLMLACCAVSVVLFPIASFAPSNAVALASCVLVGLTGSCLWPSTLAVAADRFPRGGATMFAVLAAIGNFGGIFMPWVVGAVAEVSSLRWGIATSTLCPLLMIGALLWMARGAKQADTAGDAALAPSATA